MPYEAMFAETILMPGHHGDRIDAYLARPFGAGPYPGVVVVHHMPGWAAVPAAGTVRRGRHWKKVLDWFERHLH